MIKDLAAINYGNMCVKNRERERARERELIFRIEKIRAVAL